MSSPSVELFENIDAAAELFCKIGTAVFTNKCYMTLKSYDICMDSDFYQMNVDGTYCDYPWNAIRYHKNNQSLFPCFQTLFCIHNNTLPHTIDNQYHNLPRIIKIPRSGRRVCQAIAVNSNVGIRFKESKSLGDGIKRIRIRFHWDPQFKNKQKIGEETLKLFAQREFSPPEYKDVRLEDLIDLNPEIKKNGLVFTIPKIKIQESMTDLEKDVVGMSNARIHEWCENEIRPIIDLYKNIVQVSYKIV